MNPPSRDPLSPIPAIPAGVTDGQSLYDHIKNDPEQTYNWILALHSRNVQADERLVEIANENAGLQHTHSENEEAQKRIIDLTNEIAGLRHTVDLLQNGKQRPRLEVKEFNGDKPLYQGFRTMLTIKLKEESHLFPLERDAISYLVSKLSGNALNQLFPYVKDGDYKLETVQQCIDVLDQAYLDPERRLRASHEIQTIKQRNRPFADFMVDFRRLQIDVDFNESALKSLLYQAISDELRQALVHQTFSDDLPFADYVSALSSIDHKLRAAAALSRPFRFSGFSDNQRSSSRPFVPSSSRPFVPSAGDPMDLSSTQTPAAPTSARPVTRGPLSLEERTHRMANNLCLYCGKGGHIARECPSRRTRDNTMQLHATSTQEVEGKE